MPHCKGIWHEQMDPSPSCSNLLKAKSQSAPKPPGVQGWMFLRGHRESHKPSPPQPSFLTAKPPGAASVGNTRCFLHPPRAVTELHPCNHPGTFFSTSNFPPRGSAHPPSQPTQSNFFPPKCQAEEQQQTMETCLGNNYVPSQPEHEYSTSPRGAGK